MTLSEDDKAELTYFLAALQEHLEGAIESCILRPLPDEDTERMEVLMTAEIHDQYAPDIERDRQDWRKVENWLLKLEAVE
jgi:hypothetical protein